MNAFDKFSLLAGLNPNETKYEIVGIGTLKRLSLDSVVWIALSLLNILGMHFYYNEKLENEENLIRPAWKIETVLKLWRMRNSLRKEKLLFSKL